jgi:hypothetical protein
VPERTRSSRKPGSSQIFRHLVISGHLRTTARTWITGLAAPGPARRSWSGIVATMVTRRTECVSAESQWSLRSLGHQVVIGAMRHRVGRDRHAACTVAGESSGAA